MIKNLLLAISFALPLSVCAQEYTKTDRELRFTKAEKVALFKSLKDTAAAPAFENPGKSPAYYYVVGTTASPKWLAVEHKGKVYFTSSANVDVSFKDKLAQLSADSKKKDAKLLALDEKNGFRTYHFGDAVSSIPHLKVDEKDGDTVFYTKLDENLKIGDANLKDITYGFYKGKLYFILVRTKGLIDSRKVLAALESQYGSGYQSNRYMEKYYWLGDKTTASYDENSITNDANIIFSSNEISKQKEEDKKKAAIKAGSDL